MSNLLIRSVPDEALDLFRAAAEEKGESLQEYLWQAVIQQATYDLHQQTLKRVHTVIPDGVPGDDEAYDEGNTP